MSFISLQDSATNKLILNIKKVLFHDEKILPWVFIGQKIDKKCKANAIMHNFSISDLF